jgi:hypothetical protein
MELESHVVSQWVRRRQGDGLVAVKRPATSGYLEILKRNVIGPVYRKSPYEYHSTFLSLAIVQNIKSLKSTVSWDLVILFVLF